MNFSLRGLGILSLLALLAPAPAQAQATPETVRVELNNVESVKDRCRLTFVVENKNKEPVESLQLDLALFDQGGVVRRRIATEVGPLRAAKTIVKTFVADGPCGEVGAILVNEVTACKPGKASECLDALALETKVKGVRLFK